MLNIVQVRPLKLSICHCLEKPNELNETLTGKQFSFQGNYVGVLFLSSPAQSFDATGSYGPLVHKSKTAQTCWIGYRVLLQSMLNK